LETAPSKQATSQGGRTAAKVVLKKGSTGKFRFNLVAPNGQVIATSEAYESKASAINGIESVKRNASNAEIDDQTDKEPAVTLDACIGLVVPGRPIGPWSRRTGAPKASRPDGNGLPAGRSIGLSAEGRWR
jgi:uncharacterized protein YegP (UPF0339 family)